MWLVFFPIIPPTESVIFIPYILKTVGQWGRPGGIGALFLALENNYYFDLMSYLKFIIDIISRSSSNQL